MTSKLQPSNFVSPDPSSLVVVVLEDDAVLEDDRELEGVIVVEVVEVEVDEDAELADEVLGEAESVSKVDLSSVIAVPLLVVSISPVTTVPPLIK